MIANSYVLLTVIEAILIALITVLTFRRRVGGDSQKYAAEAFYRGYASDRGLTVEERSSSPPPTPKRSSPSSPTGSSADRCRAAAPGSLALSADGTKRSDRVAVVAGPRGPIAESELEAEPPGLSAKDLDIYFDQLSGELKGAATTGDAK